jgi:hypothetical protein
LVLLNKWALAKLSLHCDKQREIAERLKVREHCYGIEMEKVAKVLLILTMLLLVFSSDVEGGRQLKSKEQVDHPQTFLGNGGIGGLRGFIPTPGFGGAGVGSGPSSFCAIFPAGCVPILPTIPGGSIGVGTPPP